MNAQGVALGSIRSKPLSPERARHHMHNPTNDMTWFVVVASLSLLVIPGCGEKEPEFGQVSGVVRVNGQPQGRLLVRFLPDPEKGNALPYIASGKTDKDGKYSLHYAWQDKEGDGAPVGWHRVVLQDTALSGIPQGQAPPPPVI